MKDRNNPAAEYSVALKPASQEEEGLFYSDEKQDEVLGTVGHLRIDFGSGGKSFWSTWWPHNADQLNTPEFKRELQHTVDTLRRDGPLQSLTAMSSYCWKHGGEISKNDRVYGYIAETEHYRFCLRCTPRPEEYQGYLYCYDLRQQRMQQQDQLVGRVTYASGEVQEFTDPQEYLQAIREELPYPAETAWEDVQAANPDLLPLWAEVPEATAAAEECITTLNLRYRISGNMVTPIPPPGGLRRDLRDKYLWLSGESERKAAIRWVYIVGAGWKQPAFLRQWKRYGYPLVPRYQADGITEQGAYLSLEITPWEYDALMRRTLERREREAERVRIQS